MVNKSSVVNKKELIRLWEDSERTGDYAYRLHFGSVAASKTLEGVNSYALARALQLEVADKILSNLDIEAQQGLINRANSEGIVSLGPNVPVKGVAGQIPENPMMKKSPYIGAIVVQREGNPVKVNTYFQSENLNQNYAEELKLPRLEKTGFDIVYYFYKDSQGNIQHRRMHFLSYNRQGKLVEVNARSAHDIIVLETDKKAEENGDWSKSDVLWFGKNATNKEILNVSIGTLMHQIAVENAHKTAKQLKRRMVFEAVLLPINVLGGYGVGGIVSKLSQPWAQAGIRLIYDMLFTAWELPTGAKMQGPPSKDTVETFISSYLFFTQGPGKNREQKGLEFITTEDKSGNLTITDEEFRTYVENQKKDTKSPLNLWLTMAMDDEASKGFVKYVQGQRKFAIAMFSIGILDNLARLNTESYNTPGNAFKDILASRYFSLTGEVNVLAVIGAIAGNDVLGAGVHMGAFREGWGNFWENYLNFFGVTVDAKAVINTLSTLFTKDGSKVFEYTPEVPQRRAFSLYFLGFPIMTYFDLKNTEGFINSSTSFAFEMESSKNPFNKKWWKDKVTQYTEDEFKQLKLVPLGKVKAEGENGQPIWRVYYINADTGGIVFLGDKGYKSKLQRLKDDVQLFDRFMSLIGEGGGRIEKKSYDAGAVVEIKRTTPSQQQSSQQPIPDLTGKMLSFALNVRHPLTGVSPSHVYDTKATANNINWAFTYDMALQSLGFSAGGCPKSRMLYLIILFKTVGYTVMRKKVSLTAEYIMR